MLVQELHFLGCLIRVEAVPATELGDSTAWTPKITASRDGAALDLDALKAAPLIWLTDKEALREGVDYSQLLVKKYLEAERPTTLKE